MKHYLATFGRNFLKNTEISPKWKERKIQFLKFYLSSPNVATRVNGSSLSPFIRSPEKLDQFTRLFS